MSGTLGYGTQLLYGTLGGTASTAIAQITNIGGPNIEVDDIEETTMDKPTGEENWKVFAPGLIDGGEVSFDILYEKAVSTAVWALVGVAKSFKILWPDNSYCEFNGYLKSLGHETPKDADITNSCTIKISGKPAFTAGS